MRLDEFEFPDELRYMKGHFWVKMDGGEATLGITSLGSSLTKEIVHIDMPDNDESFESLEPIASFETIKSVTEIHSPFDCKITEVNEKLLDDPSLINADPYGRGWILKMNAAGEADKNNLMDVSEAIRYYKKILDKEKERYEGIYENE
jgi:glycine cleavage system H protein